MTAVTVGIPLASVVTYKLDDLESAAPHLGIDPDGNDLIELGVGDAMSIGFDAFNRDSVIIEGMAVEQRTEALVRLGYDRAVASTISESFDEFNVFKQPFRVRDYTLEWDYQSGLTISADLQNFVNIKGLEP